MNGSIISVLLVPLIGVLVIAAIREKPNVRETATILTAITVFLLTLSIFTEVSSGVTVSWRAIEMMPGLSIYFDVFLIKDDKYFE